MEKGQQKLYPLPRILHLPPQHRAKDHLDILDKGIMPIIIAIQPNLIRIDDRVVILHRYVLRLAGVAFFLFLGYILGDHLVFEAVFQRGRTSDARPQLQHVAVVALQLVDFPE